MPTWDALSPPSLSRYCCAACEQRVAADELPRSVWVEDEAVHGKRLYHVRCWLAQRCAAD